MLLFCCYQTFQLLKVSFCKADTLLATKEDSRYDVIGQINNQSTAINATFDKSEIKLIVTYIL